MSGIEISRAAWDSCVFLAWFENEQDKPLAEIKELLEDIAAERLTLVVSAIVGAEVLDRAGVSTAGTQFREYIKRPNIIRADADFRVGERAAEIRQRANDAIASGRIKKGVKAPDAMIVATALIYKADVLHTFDPVLIGLDQDPVVEGLRITEPTSGFSSLPIVRGTR